MRKLNTPLPMKKATLLFPSNPCLTVEVLSSPPLSKIYLEVQPPPRGRGGGGGGGGGAYYEKGDTSDLPQ